MMMIERFRLASRLSPDECRETLRAVLGKNGEPRGWLRGSLFRIKLWEYFREDDSTSIPYTGYGTIRDNRGGQSVISCWQFKGAADPFWLVILFFPLLIGFSLLTSTPSWQALPRNAGCALLAYLGLVASTSFGFWLCQLQTQTKPRGRVAEVLCEILDAEKL